MAGTFQRSWDITKLSFNVISQDKELLLFPLFASIFSIAFIIAMAVPSVMLNFVDTQAMGVLGYGLIFIIYLGIAFIATFFNVCVVYTIKTRFEGGNATFFESIRFAFSRLHLIFSWALVAATVGLILRIIDNLAERLGVIGEIIVKILTSILGAVWSIITIFVVPTMVYEGLGPFPSIKRSVEVLKKTWGESLIRYYGLGMVQFLFMVIVIIIGGALGFFTMTISPIGGLVILGIAFIALLAIILIFTVANSVFNTALFVYANTGKVPGGFNQDTLQGAFTQKRKMQ